MRKHEYVESSFHVGEKNYKWAPKTSLETFHRSFAFLVLNEQPLS